MQRGRPRLLLALGVALFATSNALAGETIVVGQIRFRGEVPLSPVADDQGTRPPLLAVHQKSLGLADAIVWLDPLDDQKPQQFNKNVDPLVIDQKNMLFSPRVNALRGGQRVRFTNSDPANHNVRAASIDVRNTFNVFTGTGGSYEHRFEAAKQLRPVVIGCDIHAWMRAWVFVFDHNWFAVTDQRGRYHIQPVPPGAYRWQVRQPDGGLIAKREITVGHDGQAVELDHEFGVRDLRAD